MKNLYLHLIVFVCGAAVLAIEVLGTRILGPFYGVSLFLWWALITVTLIALSIRYAAGGRWADKGATLVTSLGTTLKQHFNEVFALPISESPNTLGNIVLLASRRRHLVFHDEMLGRPFDYPRENYMDWYILQMNHAWDNRFVPESDSNLILTDDLNPVEVRAEEINNIARRQLHSHFGENGLNW